MSFYLFFSSASRVRQGVEPLILNEEEGVCELPAEPSFTGSFPADWDSLPPQNSYASRIFSDGDDGASGAGPGYSGPHPEPEPIPASDDGLSLWQFLGGLIPFFSLSGCASEERVNPAPEGPCTPKEELAGGGAPNGGGGGAGGAGGGDFWICPDYPEDPIYNPDETGEPGSDTGY